MDLIPLTHANQCYSNAMRENYLSHPTFGLLFSLCPIGENQALFTTLYAQRLFFRVTFHDQDPANPLEPRNLSFDPISRNEARQLLEEQIRILRRHNQSERLAQLQGIYKQTFA